VAAARITRDAGRSAARAGRQLRRNQSSFDAITGGAGNATLRSVRRNTSRALARVGMAAGRAGRSILSKLTAFAAALVGTRSPGRGTSRTGRFAFGH
jgi:hypothetical protein